MQQSRKKPPVLPDTPSNRRLLTALARNDAELARRAFAEGASPTAVAAQGYPQPLLSRAVLRDRQAVVEVILAQGGDPGVAVQGTAHSWGSQTEAPRPFRYRPAFVFQAQKGPIERTRAWLERYPSCRTPEVLAEALHAVPEEDPDTYALLLNAARALPPREWARSGVVAAELPKWVAQGSFARVQDLWALAPPSSPQLLTLALCIAITRRNPAMAAWFLDQGADPTKDAPEHPHLRLWGARDARSVAIAFNQPAVLAALDARAPRRDASTLAAWAQTLRAAFDKGSRQVFHEVWRSGAWSLDKKQKVLESWSLPSRDPQKKGAPVSPVEWAIHGQNEYASWVREIIATGTTTKATRTAAAHVLCSASDRWRATRDARALRTLAEAGVDWEAPSSKAPFHTLEQTLKTHKILSAHPMVQRLLAARAAALLTADLPAAPSEAPPAPRRLRL